MAGEHPLPEGGAAFSSEERELTRWQSRWSIDASRTVWVLARRPDGSGRVIDARYWIETLHDATMWPDGTTFELVVEAK